MQGLANKVADNLVKMSALTAACSAEGLMKREATVAGRAKTLAGIFCCHLCSLALLCNVRAKCIPALVKQKSILVPCSPAKQGRETSREWISVKCQEVEE